MNLSDILSSFLAPIATAVGVVFAAFQLWQSSKQAVTTFEDGLVQQYREIIKNIPIDALLGEEIVYGKYMSALEHFYRYIDLCNEQIFLRQEGRVRESTWKNWQEGIHSNLSRPAFKEAWKEIKSRSHEASFTELKRLEECGFSADPAKWNLGRRK